MDSDHLRLSVLRAFHYLIRRILNEVPLADSRWRSFLKLPVTNQSSLATPRATSHKAALASPIDPCLASRGSGGRRSLRSRPLDSTTLRHHGFTFNETSIGDGDQDLVRSRASEFGQRCGTTSLSALSVAASLQGNPTAEILSAEPASQSGPVGWSGLLGNVGFPFVGLAQTACSDTSNPALPGDLQRPSVASHVTGTPASTPTSSTSTDAAASVAPMLSDGSGALHLPAEWYRAKLVALDRLAEFWRQCMQNYLLNNPMVQPLNEESSSGNNSEDHVISPMGGDSLGLLPLAQAASWLRLGVYMKSFFSASEHSQGVGKRRHRAGIGAIMGPDGRPRRRYYAGELADWNRTDQVVLISDPLGLGTGVSGGEEAGKIDIGLDARHLCTVKVDEPVLPQYAAELIQRVDPELARRAAEDITRPTWIDGHLSNDEPSEIKDKDSDDDIRSEESEEDDCKSPALSSGRLTDATVGLDIISQLGRPSLTHLVCSLATGAELLEGMHYLQTRLLLDPPPESIQSILSSVCMSSGFPASGINLLRPGELLRQTPSLLPRLLIRLSASCHKMMLNLVAPEAETISTADSPVEKTPSTKNVIHQASAHGLLPRGSEEARAQALAHIRSAAGLVTAAITAAVRLRRRHLIPRARYELQAGKAAVDVTGRFKHGKLPGSCVIYWTCWITDAWPYGIGTYLLKMLDLLSRVCRLPYASSGASSRLSSLIGLSVELAGSLLTAAESRVNWAEEQQSVIDQNDLRSEGIDASSTEEGGCMDTEGGDQGANKDRSRGGEDDEGQTESSQRIFACQLQSVQRMHRMRVWFARLRTRLITFVADRLGRPEAGLELAVHYTDREQILRLCLVLEDAQAAGYNDGFQPDGPMMTSCLDPVQSSCSNFAHHSRLAGLLNSLPVKLNLPDYALQWHLDRGDKARVQSLLALLQTMQRTSENSNTEHQGSVPVSTVSGLSLDERPLVNSHSVPSHGDLVDPVFSFSESDAPEINSSTLRISELNQKSSLV
ncbi:unnamed protein product [Protopolystoma xenopodis]|uniref:Uncharacterized protein n=1 Tax=Protopolystoma xenopodis TaxID=117903 RepID=A0A3S4ZTN9_9PLAT|nr:unnamed protein product [Protopolystoma xenopodis]